ncbi:MAG TPA: MBL fold metallo-hydrolase [Burkholderiaceae bacterium]|nr:MBL fold metallo-hydrolase [Burkholderiaceae bacterium]
MTLPVFVEPLGPGLYAIDTGFIRARYDAAYLVVSDGRAGFIDTGTNHALPRHLAALDALGLARSAVDVVMPTHVHLDHAGGAGALMRELPNATLAIHPRGERHMVDPTALYEGALAVYGAEAMARDYGQLVPIPAERVRVLRDGDAVRIGARTLLAADTPGHARHHHCYWDEVSRGWFTGDTFGISLREFDRPGRGAWLGPSIVPSQFDPEALRASIARLLARDPRCVYVTHYGRVDDPAAHAPAMLALMDRMVEVGLRHRSAPDRRERLARAFEALYLDSLAAHGVTDRDAARPLIAVDIELAVQGMEVWLDREEKKA